MENYVILIPTFHKRHKYLPDIDKILDENWAERPATYFISDQPTPPLNSGVIISNYTSWCETLFDALLRIESVNNSDFIFILIEDLVPLKKINNNILENDIIRIKENNIESLVYLTYDSKAERSIVNIDNKQYKIVSKDYKYYSQLQPGFWNREALKKILIELISKNKKSAWDFEFEKTPGIHLESLYPWPNLLGGFFEYGRVNVETLKLMHGTKTLRKLRNKLFFDALIINPWRRLRISIDKIKHKLWEKRYA